MNFTNKAILCDTWEQMEHLARIADEQGYRPIGFVKSDFDKRDLKYFIVLKLSFKDAYTNGIPARGETETTYTQFINQSDTPSVYGC